MASPDISITLEIEPIVKLYCSATSCKHNLFNAYIKKDKLAACNLKHITIGNTAKCLMYEEEKK